MSSSFKAIFIITLFMLLRAFGFAQLPADSVKQLLCSRSWHLVKLTDMSGKGQSMGGELFNIDTKFNADGTIETSTAGNITHDHWTLATDGVSMETDQLKDPKTGQEKIRIIEISARILKIQITYRGNNIMQYDYN